MELLSCMFALPPFTRFFCCQFFHISQIAKLCLSLIIGKNRSICEGLCVLMDEWLGMWSRGCDQLEASIKSLHELLGAPWVLPLAGLWSLRERGQSNYWHLSPTTTPCTFVLTRPANGVVTCYFLKGCQHIWKDHLDALQMFPATDTCGLPWNPFR